MQHNKTIRVLIIDDHPMVVEGLKSVISHLPGMLVTGTAQNGAAAFTLLQKMYADIVLLDINLPDMSGTDLCKRLKQESPELKILCISTFSERSYVCRMISNGASGYLIKNATATEIAKAIGTVLAGKLHIHAEMEYLCTPSTVKSGNQPLLTSREKEVLNFIAEGFSNNKIAEKLSIRPGTVDTHRKNLLMKMNVNNTASLIREAAEKGLI